MRRSILWIGMMTLATGLTLITLAWAGGKKPGKGQKNPKWFTCSTISDCTVAHGLCGAPTGVNVRHLKSYDQWVGRRQARIRCQGGIQSVQRAVLACKHGVCQAGKTPDSKDSPRLSFATEGTCADISECTVSRSVCGDPLGIPWILRKEWEADVRRRAVAVDCPDSVRPVRRAILACEKGRCKAGADPSSPPADSPDQVLLPAE